MKRPNRCPAIGRKTVRLMLTVLRGLFWLAVVIVLTGCDRKTETIRQGIRDVDKHAKEIEKAANSPNE